MLAATTRLTLITLVSFPLLLLAASTSYAQSVRWIDCAFERGLCQFDGVQAVRYGRNSTWTEQIAKDEIGCNNSVFGDPLKGTFKQCQTADVVWVRCALERQRCEFEGTRFVRYGKNSTWVSGEHSDDVDCSNAVFGDPLKGTRKECQIAELPTADTEPPSPPGGLEISNLECESATLSWSAASDNVGVAAYDIYHDGQFIKQVGGNTVATELTLVPGALWGFYVNALDAAGNLSQASETLSVRIPQCELDTEPPTVPTGLTGSASGTSISLQWNPASDNIGVRTYDVFRDGSKVGSTDQTSFVDSALAQNQEYQYAVSAVDAQQNSSALSDEIRVTTGSSCEEAVCSVEQAAAETDIPWGLVTLPDGAILYARRDAQDIIHLKDGVKTNIGTVPNVVGTDGEGGLLGLEVTGEFPTNDNWLYIFHTSPTDNRVVRMRVDNNQLQGDPQVLLAGIKKNKFHNGGRLRFGPDGKLYVATGDAQIPASAQDRDELIGKILRMNADGSVPADNPFNNYVWSYGHRNPQGLAFDSQGRLWQQEFGNSQQDETNLVVKGGNYGWPDCEGTVSRSGDGCATSGFIAPKQTYATRDASCSGIAIVQDALYVACLRGRRLYRMDIDGDALTNQQQLFVSAYGRLRTVEPGIDGGLWLTTSNGGDKDNIANNSSTEIFKVTLGSPQSSDDLLQVGETYTITNKRTQRLLTVDGGSQEPAANVKTEPASAQAWQRWRLELEGDAYVLFAEHSEQALNIAGRADIAGSAIQWPYRSDHRNAQWRIEPTANGYFILTSVDNGEALDEEVPSSNVTEYPRHGRDNQQWLLREAN